MTECEDQYSVPIWHGAEMGGVHFVDVIIIYNCLNEGKTLASYFLMD